MFGMCPDDVIGEVGKSQRNIDRVINRNKADARGGTKMEEVDNAMKLSR